MELAFQLTHNSRLSIGYQTVTDAHRTRDWKGPIVFYEVHTTELSKPQLIKFW